MDVAGQAARDGPDCTSIERAQQHGMGHQPRNAAIPIQKWMYPEKPMVSSSRGKDRFGLADVPVNLLESSQKAGQGSGTDSDVPANLNVPCPQIAWYDAVAFFGDWVLYPEKVFRQQLAKAPVNLLNFFDARCFSAFQAAFIDPPLDMDVRLGFKLQIPLVRILAEFVFERPLNVYRVGVVPFNEIGVVAVHRPH
jgi:hypothetical protein